ncbi:predicted protein [Sclerotinia sclerotiorum 1980 UF-70]|uniref:Uncharacterized protein n=1 Tax=Sclerotinia sclerotiorum (strain ATCC 18683 / 1980 / Ss-1) TaxID=665079 RepID=A7E7Y4_SCLS1|nr:predicted protein [Sclerotinia sclerotiorum 1980 UF-70]EDN96486.1 predicted protein [Sclerotinia sclerotiorum 1980 UF-70]
MVLAADREDFIVPPERFKESPLHRGQVVETSSLSNYEKLMLPSFTRYGNGKGKTSLLALTDEFSPSTASSSQKIPFLRYIKKRALDPYLNLFKHCPWERKVNMDKNKSVLAPSVPCSYQGLARNEKMMVLQYQSKLLRQSAIPWKKVTLWITRIARVGGKASQGIICLLSSSFVEGVVD